MTKSDPHPAAAPTRGEQQEMIQRITSWLMAGGCFNPGLTASANEDATRQLMFDARAVLGAALPAHQERTEPLSHQFNLSAIRRWIDEGFAKWAQQSGFTVPNGFAGEAAAAVWLHAQAIVNVGAPARAAEWQPLREALIADMREQRMYYLDKDDAQVADMIEAWIEKLVPLRPHGHQ